MQLLDLPLPILDTPVDADALVLHRLGDLLQETQALDAGQRLRRLIDAGLDRLPRPADGQTLQRWRLLARVAGEDLALAKLYESHADALAILEELEPATPPRAAVRTGAAGAASMSAGPGAPGANGATGGGRTAAEALAASAVAAAPVLTEVVVDVDAATVADLAADLAQDRLARVRPDGSPDGFSGRVVYLAHARPAYGVWAAEGPETRVTATLESDGRVLLNGRKPWCSGAAEVQRGLLTVWLPDGTGPWLADVDLRQPGVRVDDATWAAVGMAGTGTADVSFDQVPARLVGGLGAYLDRPGFWHGGAGIAACWHGALETLAEALRLATSIRQGEAWHLQLALGQVDGLLSANAATLREAAMWMDRYPTADARAWALRVRTATDEVAQQVLRSVARALGPGPFCRTPRLARLMADLPIFLRQSHGDRDLAMLGTLAAAGAAQAGGVPWRL